MKNNPIIRAFAGVNSEISNIPQELYNFNHDSTPAADIYQVVNADSSQQDAILLSQKGISFVMQGPPGTGKSQTITNIIAQGLADGKRILFVSEKAAALEVVHKRLSEVHLDDFCLALHNYKANKKEVLDELGKSLALSRIKVKEEEKAKLLYIDKYNRDDKKYFIAAIDLLGKLYELIHNEQVNTVFQEESISTALEIIRSDIEALLEIWNMYESNRTLLHQSEDITVAQYLELIDMIKEYHKQNEEKENFEKNLRQTLKDTINSEMSNLSDIRQGINIVLWHYRSRNEDLIAFSNQEIYKNKLTTFPSSNTVAADSGVEYVYVKDGTYSGRCNVKEAQKCVELIKQHIIKHQKRSLGVIAFSEKQQATIEEAVQKFRESNPKYEKFFSEEKEEPFFIKNLENVQGDERDTIIFSICYAKDPNGRMYMRFGPLGHQGGERRLNVAITRAKYNIKLVGSIMPYDIDLSKTKSEGVRMLKDYIEFAIKGSSVLRPHKNLSALYDTDEFCNGILKFIKSKGYSAKQYVGSSEYKIDIAVEHPQYPGCYVAGIECDGNTYFMARTTRDREHLRKSILEQMGWNMFRVWSTEWINNKEGEQRRLLDFIDSAIKNYKKTDYKEKIKVPEKKEESVQVEVLQKTPENQSSLKFPYYQIGDWRKAEYDYNKGNLQNLSARIRAVVEVEQPIHLDILYRRLASAFGNEKATKPIRHTIDQALETVMKDEIIIEDNFVRFKNFTDIRARIPTGTQDRNIEYISKPEIADAMMMVIKSSYGIDKDDLCAEVTSIFGYDRMGTKISKAMNETIDYMIEKGMISIFDDKMHIN